MRACRSLTYYGGWRTVAWNLGPEGRMETAARWRGYRCKINFTVPSQKALFSCCSYNGFHW
jgi:hypothetical protein